jgi:hypothetical protein
MNMDIGSYHIFTIISTVVSYILLRYTYQDEKTNSHQKILIYTALIPIMLYGYYYVYVNGEEQTIMNHQLQPQDALTATELMSDSYPGFSSL